jgi:hypothetical protein
MTMATVNPSFASFSSESISCCVMVLSSPDVGSSKKSTNGEAMSSMPMFTRFLCPPEMPLVSSSPIKLCCTWLSPRMSTISFTNARRCGRVMFGLPFRCA